MRRACCRVTVRGFVVHRWSSNKAFGLKCSSGRRRTGGSHRLGIELAQQRIGLRIHRHSVRVKGPPMVPAKTDGWSTSCFPAGGESRCNPWFSLNFGLMIQKSGRMSIICLLLVALVYLHTSVAERTSGSLRVVAGQPTGFPPSLPKATPKPTAGLPVDNRWLTATVS